MLRGRAAEDFAELPQEIGIKGFRLDLEDTLSVFDIPGAAREKFQGDQILRGREPELHAIDDGSL